MAFIPGWTVPPESRVKVEVLTVHLLIIYYAIFIVRQLQEKYLAESKDLWMAFVDLEKAFDRVPREVVWWVLRYLGVDEWIMSVIMAMYEDASTKARMNGRESRAFNVKVGVHQGSVLSPLQFIIVLEALSREFRE